MDKAAYIAWLVAIWPALLAITVYCVITRNWDGLRCAVLLGAAQWGMDMYLSYTGWLPAYGQPWQAHLVIYTICCIIATILPVGRICSLLGAVFIAGVAWAIVRCVVEYTIGTSSAVDYLYWRGTLYNGWLMLIITAGGATGETGKRIIHSLWRGVIGVPDASGGKGMAT